MPTFAEKCADAAMKAQVAYQEKLLSTFHGEVVHKISTQIEIEAANGQREHVVGSYYSAYNNLFKSYYENPLMGFKVEIRQDRVVISW